MAYFNIEGLNVSEKEGCEMKQLEEDEVNFLFDWVKNWYPTEAKPKMAILLLNRQEWKQLYEDATEKAMPQEERWKILDEKAEELSSEEQELYHQFKKLPEEKRKQLYKLANPHYGEKEQDLDYWMNETLGSCYSVKTLKQMCKLFNQTMLPFFQPYANYDFVIIISNFFNEEQEKSFAKHGKKIAEYLKKRLIHATIFHELIHIIEHCTGNRIFKTDSLEECNSITFPLAQKYLDDDITL
jgi:hypothetical protein